MWVGPVPVVVSGKDVTLEIDVLNVPRSGRPLAAQRALVARGGFAVLPGIPPGVTVSGQVLSSVPQAASATRRVTGVLPIGTATAELYLIADSGESAGRRVIGWTSNMGSPTNGLFEIRNVPPGSYVLYASLPDLSGYSASAPPGQAVDPVAFGRTSIVVGNSDLQAVTIRVHQGVSVQGRLTVDGAPPAPGTVEIALRSDDSAFGIPVYQQVGRFRPVISVGGGFTIPAVPEGRYRLAVTMATKPAARVADILQAGASIRDTGLIVHDSAPAPVEVVVRAGGK
jgi:hypothetical protein